MEDMRYFNGVLLFALIALLAVPLSFSIQTIEPVAMEVADGGTIDLGVMGPGQTMPLVIHPIVYNGGKFGKGGRYDIAIVTEVPKGWKGENSKLYGKPLQVGISAAKNAPDGTYYAKIVVSDENNGELLGNITITAKIRITRDIMESSVTPKTASVGPGQPAKFLITIRNKGTASDLYVVSSEGVKRWAFRKYVHMPPLSTKTIAYEVTENEEESYYPTIKVVSNSSVVISAEHNVSFTVSSNLLYDYKATNYGVLIFPTFELPIFGLAGLLSNLY